MVAAIELVDKQEKADLNQPAFPFFVSPINLLSLPQQILHTIYEHCCSLNRGSGDTGHIFNFIIFPFAENCKKSIVVILRC
jgi:hypothetical protein